MYCCTAYYLPSNQARLSLAEGLYTTDSNRHTQAKLCNLMLTPCRQQHQNINCGSNFVYNHWHLHMFQASQLYFFQCIILLSQSLLTIVRHSLSGKRKNGSQLILCCIFRLGQASCFLLSSVAYLFQLFSNNINCFTNHQPKPLPGNVKKVT